MTGTRREDLSEEPSNAFDTHATSSITEDTTLATVTSIEEADQIVYIELCPRNQALGKCVDRLMQAITTNLAESFVAVASVHRGLERTALTLGINLGPRTAIASHSEEAIKGFNFTVAVFERLFDFSPRYTGAPAYAQNLAAADLPSVLDLTPPTRLVSAGM